MLLPALPLSVSLITLILSLQAVGAAAAEDPSASHPPKSILILVDSIELIDLIEIGPTGEAHILHSLSGVAHLAEKGSVGLMNVRTAGAYNPESARLTLGAASRAAAPTGAVWLAPVSERIEVGAGARSGGVPGGLAGEIYNRRMDRPAPESGSVVLDIASLRRQNAAFHYTIRLGALGEALHEAGRGVTLLAPTLSARDEGPAGEGVPGAAVAMDAAGVVHSAVVGRRLLDRDGASATGWRTDAQAVASEMERLWDDTDVFVIDLPDGRLHMREREWMTPGAAAVAKRQAVESLDRVVRAVLGQVDLDRDSVMLAVPAPDPQGRAAGHMLTPIFLAGPGLGGGGWLSSPTTRRPGLVAITDIAPTLLAQQGVDSKDAMLGRPVLAAPHAGDAVADLAAANERMVATYVQRSPILKSFVTFQIVVWVLGLAVLLVGGRLTERWRRRSVSALQWMLLVTMSLPLSLLLASPGAFPGAWATGAVSLLGALLLAALVRLVAARRGHDNEVRSLIPVYLISLVTALALIIDLGRGAPLMQASVLGYDPMVGARYYGIGNEYMGILMGATLVGATSLEDRVRFGWPRALGLARLATLALFAAATCAVALPWWGANVGGALVAAVGTAFTTFLLYKGKATWRDLVWAGLIAVATLASLTAIDLLRAGTPSHLGQLAMAVANRGIEPFVNVVWRKVEINLRLFQYSIWSRAFAIALLVLILRFVRPSPLFRRLNGRFPSLFKGIWGATIAGMVAFAVNDSGVIAAATTTLYASGALLYLTGIDPTEQTAR